MNAPNPSASTTPAGPDGIAPAEAPRLWNPKAAACWSLFFSPIFGAWLHMKNWEALGDHAKARRSKQWAAGSAAFFVGSILLMAVLPESKTLDGLSRLAALAVLLGWYYSLGKQQNGYVLAKYGKDYPRKGWAKPLGLALAALAGFIVVGGIVGFVLGAVSGAA